MDRKADGACSRVNCAWLRSLRQSPHVAEVKQHAQRRDEPRTNDGRGEVSRARPFPCLVLSVTPLISSAISMSRLKVPGVLIVRKLACRHQGDY